MRKEKRGKRTEEREGRIEKGTREVRKEIGEDGREERDTRKEKGQGDVRERKGGTSYGHHFFS